MTETKRDPRDVAADDVFELLAERKASGVTWEQLIESLAEKATAAQRRYLLAQRQQAVFAAEGGQLPLIPGAVAAPEPRKPRAKRRVLMHEADCGGLFECQKCNLTAPIPDGMTDSARKRGVPCPRCNQDQPGRAQDEIPTVEPS